MDNNPFWQYSLQFYGRPGVEPLLLKFQDDLGGDINMLLCCCWLASRQQLVSSVQLRELISDVATWRTECLMPLRSVRRFVKGQLSLESVPKTMYESLKSLELQAEKAQQQRMVVLLEEMELESVNVPVGDAAKQNILCYRQQVPGSDKNDWQAMTAELVAL